MPHIQFELDAMELVPSVASAARITEEAVGWGLPKLWRHCWRRGDDTVSVVILPGFFAGADRELIAEVLVAFGFLESLGGGDYRVRGAERYLRISESQSAAGKARAAKAKRDSKGRLVSANIQPPAGDRLDTPPAADQPRTSSYSDQRSAISEQKSFAPTEVGALQDVGEDKGKTKTRRKSRAQENYEWAQAERAKLTDTTDQKPQAQRLEATLSPILDELGVPGFRAAWRSYLDDKDYPFRAVPPWPWALFVAQWGKYRRKAAEAAPVALQAATAGFRRVGPDEDPYRT